MNKTEIIKSEIFKKYKEIVFGVSTINLDIVDSKFKFNLSYTVGDNPENVKKNRTTFFKKLNIDEKKVCFQKQTHSVNHNYVEVPYFFKDSDALYTDKKDIYLAISIADCIPIFLYEPEKEVIAGIHSGWKGTRDKILTLTLKTLIKKYDLNPQKIIAFIGPGISGENFEVGKDVWEMFPEEYRLQKNNKYYVDLKKNNYDQLINSGLLHTNIEVSPYCTYKEKEFFHSYRRDGALSGRMLGVIGIRE